MRELVEVAWEVTDGCNFNCIHCYNPKKRDDLDKDIVFRTLDELSEMRVRQIKYGGGEPLLRKDFLDILKKTTELGFSNTVAGFPWRRLKLKTSKTFLSVVKL